MDATGRRQVVVRLDVPSAAQAAALTADLVTVQSEAQAVVVQQDGVLNYIQSVDPTVQILGRTRFALNALILEVDAAALPMIAANPAVIAVNPVVNYELDLTETVPYIGAKAPNVVSQGKGGQGVKVAVLDSGINYTHAEFGGPGTTAETNIFTRPTALGGALAPITRIGGGEVRVDRAVASPAAAWEFNNRTGALSFGFVDVTKATTRLRRTVVVHNYSNKTITYNITPSIRFTDDVTNGAVSLSAPSSIRVPARSERTFRVTLTIDGAKLREWGLNSGSQGANGPLLDTFEYDGYVTLDDPNTATADDLHQAWQVLPRQSGDVRPSDDEVKIDGATSSGEVNLRNRGIGTARIDAYSLIGTSPIMAAAGAGQNRPPVDLKAIGIATFPVGAGFCSANPSFVWTFAFTTHYRQTHADAPAEFDVFLDTNQDGTADYDIFNFDLSLSSSISDGRNVTWVANLATDSASAFFTTDHGLNSGNTILILCAEQIGMSQANFFQPMTADFVAFDWYNGNGVTDAITGLTISPLGERYLGLGATDIPSGDIQTLTVLDFGPVDTNPTETGLLLVLDASRGSIRGGAPSNNETILLTVEH